MKKVTMCLAVGMVLACAGFAQAAVVSSDDFNDGVLASQWSQGVTCEVLGVEQNGVFDVSQGWYSSGAGSSQKGAQTIGYVLSGAFDIQVDGKVNGGAPYAGNEVKLEMIVRDVNAGGLTGVYFDYVSKTTADEFGPKAVVWDNGAYEGSFSKVTDYTDDAFQLRITRDEVGAIAMYARELGAPSWDLLGTGSWTTADVEVYLISSIVKSGGSINGYFDNFVVPEPATMSLVGLGGLLALRRRRK